MSLKNILTKEMLKYEYDQLGTIQKVAKKLNISSDSVQKYMMMYNIPYTKYGKAVYTCDHNIFDRETEVSFYLAGFIAADGSLQKRKYSKTLQISLSKKDAEHLEKIKILLSSNNPIKEYTIRPSGLVKTINYAVQLNIVSKNIFDDLGKFNIVPNKTKTYQFPEWLISHPLVHHFMRGYFDGDGSITNSGTEKRKYQKSFIMIGTKQFVEYYRNILVAQCNIHSPSIFFHNNSVYRFTCSSNKTVELIYNFLYKDATIYLNRKRDKFLE